MSGFKRYTITSALPYANGPLHVGHIAGAYLPADIYVKYLRLNRADVVYVCGSDEHGAAITIQALKEGVQPQEIVDKYHELNKETFQKFNIDFDIYHRTSSELHHETASDYFKHLYDDGVFEEKEIEQFYDEENQQFLADRYITGECPKCQHPNAYGDQCEKCGSALSPTELINPKSTLSGATPVLRPTKLWYLPLNKYQEWLSSWIVDGKDRAEDWKKNVLGQCKSWIDDGLQPRAITRDLNWGVPVPLPDAEGKVLYVWLDAPIGYISATKQWAIDKGKDWEPYWKSEDTKLVHFIGKDNIVFHCIIFPSILKAHGDYVLPTNVPANEFMNLEGDKISTSRNWAVWLHEYIETYPDKIDELRYLLTSNMPETKDSEFTWTDYQARVNNELVAVLGNYVNRVVVLTHKYYQGKLDGAELIENITKEALDQSVAELTSAIERYRFRDALNAMMSIARNGNRLLTESEPWKQFKEDPEGVKHILFSHLQVLANIAIACQPFLPNTAEKLSAMLGISNKDLHWNNLGKSDMIPNDRQLGEAQLLFSKIEDDMIQKEVEKLGPKEEQTESTYVPISDTIQYDDFAKMDIRVGTITKAERVPKTDKLIHLEVDLGMEKRSVVSGIAEHFEPEKIIGQQVSLLANLAPRKLRGIESQGMILMAEDQDGKLHFVSPATVAEEGGIIK